MLEESDGEAYSGHNRSCTRAFFALAYRPTKRAPDAVMGKMAKQAMGKLVGGFTFMAIGTAGEPEGDCIFGMEASSICTVSLCEKAHVELCSGGTESKCLHLMKSLLATTQSECTC